LTFPGPVSKNSRVATHSLLTIPVRAGREEAFVEAFHRLDVFGHAAQVQAFRGGELLRPQGGGGEFVVHAVWDGADGYQAWLDAPVRATLTAEIEPLVAGPMTSRLYDEL
jgi:heme-degrading monooxygenase HmoA